MSLARVSTLFLCLIAATAGAVEPKWTQRQKVGDISEGNVMVDVVWKKKSGAEFRIAETDGHRVIELTLDHRNPKVVLKASMKDKGEAVSQARFDLEALPDMDLARAEVVLKLRTDMWTLYVQNLPVAQWPAPFDAPLSLWQPTDEIPTNSPDDAVYTQKTADIHFAADFLVPEGQENPLGDWEPVGGEWEIRTVMEEVMEAAPTDRIKQRPIEAERSPNFSSLRGHGEDAIILNGYDFYDNYQIEAAMLTEPGQVGLVFYYQGERDYYSMVLTTASDTATEVRVELWRHSSQRQPRVLKLAEVMVPVTAHQWVKPAVKVWNEQLICYLDDSELFRVMDELPVGGRFGLLANSESPMRFDDVSVRTIRELNLSDTDRIAFHTLQTRGEFFQTSSFLGLFRRDLERRPDLPVPVSSSDKWLLLGAYDDMPHVFGATFTPTGYGSMGLVLGYRDASQAHLRLLYTLNSHSESFTLQRVKMGETEDIDHFRQPAPSTDQLRPIRLLADPTENGVLRLYRDDDMVFAFYPEDVPFMGASGIFVGANTEVTVSDLTHKSTRDHVYRNQYEKNRNYVVDPFMRHWSSPEGQWFTDPAGLTWHKSDFFGRFDVAMPYVDGSVIHLGVEEERTIGTVSVKVDGTTLAIYESNGRELSEAEPVTTGTIPPAVIEAAATPPANPQDRLPAFTVHNEGYWIWVTCGREVIARHRLARPLSGRRLRIEGYATTDLMSCVVDVYNIKDYLFNRAITDWTRNGGSWEVVNRFQCDPRWSHMNGQSADNLGALWAKYEFRGDFSVEMYVGVRHGSWYNRGGDMNITVMNDVDSPNSGYSLVTTGWDNNHSQNWSRLYRDGEVIAESDMYLVPRIRFGNTRKYLDPLISDGRPIHGAWYHIKFRRIGDTLEYWFDNQLVFRTKEPADKRPDAGGMGIWTYMNSIMIARVKISAESILPREIKTSPVRAQDAWVANRLSVERHRRVLTDGRPLQQVLPEFWSTEDHVGFTKLDWYEDHAERPYFVATNTLGGGEMFVSSSLPPMPMASLAGFAFQMKRTPGALVNFHYEIGKMNGEKFVPLDKRYMQLSGPEMRESGFTRTGSATIPPVASNSPNWHTRDSWSFVRAWLPTVGYEAPAADLMVRVVGFGIRQPSYAMQGLTGNRPGAAYAVTGLAPIRMNPPTIVRNPEHSELIPQSFLLRWPTGDRPPARSEGLTALAGVLAADARAGFNHRIVRATFRGQIADADVYWVTQPESPEWTVAWDPEHEGAILVTSPKNGYDRRLFQVPITARDTALEVETVDQATRRAYLPRETTWMGITQQPLEVKVGEQTVSLDWSKRKPEQPVLLSVDGFSPFVETFESAQFGSHLTAQPPRMRVDRFVPEQDTVLHVWNETPNQRLSTTYQVPFNLAHYPLLTFRYRAEDMANVSIRLNRSTIDFSEERAEAPKVRLAPEVHRDNAWHTWTGMVTDVNEGDFFQTDRFNPGSLLIASIANPDQTGAHSAMDLDDLSFGPAVRTADQLAFTPTYFDYGGLRSIHVATLPGSTPWDSLDTASRTRVRWSESAPGTMVKPSLEGLPQGLNYVLVKAVDSDGRSSVITSLPFLYDTAPLQVAHNFEILKEPWSNGNMLRVAMSADQGAPPNLETLKLLWDGVELRPNSRYNRLLHSADSTVATINWPYELRGRIEKMNDGESGTLTITGLADGAGNPSPDVTVPITIDHATDKFGPTPLAPKMPDNVAIHINWFGDVNLGAQFVALQHNSMTIVANWQQEPYVVNGAHQAQGGASINSGKWKLETHPYFAFRMMRPEVPEGDKLTLRLDVTFTDGKTHVVTLTPKGKKSDPATTVTWTPGEWQTVNLDLVKALGNAVTGDKIKTAVVKTITIRRIGTQHTEKLALMAACAYAPWAADDAVVLSAFDASGVAGLQWEYVDGDGTVQKTGTIDGTTIVPATLGLPAVTDGWLLVYTMDRAGNRSIPLRLPITP